MKTILSILLLCTLSAFAADTVPSTTPTPLVVDPALVITPPAPSAITPDWDNLELHIAGSAKQNQRYVLVAIPYLNVADGSRAARTDVIKLTGADYNTFLGYVAVGNASAAFALVGTKAGSTLNTTKIPAAVFFNVIAPVKRP